MLFLIRRPKADLKILPGGGPFHLGGTIRVLVSLAPYQSFRIREGHVELVYTETYEEVEAEAEGISGGSVNIHRVVASEPILMKTDVISGVPHQVEVQLPVPSNARPSSESSTLEINWSIRTTLDIPLARDIHQRERLTILPQASG